MEKELIKILDEWTTHINKLNSLQGYDLEMYDLLHTNRIENDLASRLSIILKISRLKAIRILRNEKR